MNHEAIKKMDLNSQKIESTALETDHPPLDPKFIRGPTRYQPGPIQKTKGKVKGTKKSVQEVRMKPRQGRPVDAQFLGSQSFDQADMQIGALPDQQKVLYASRKNDQTSLVNSYTEKQVDLARAKPLFKRELTTFAEHVEDAFCYLIDDDMTSNHFMKYLERAAHDSETESIVNVFPFLNHEGHMHELNRLMLQKSELQTALSQSGDQTPNPQLEAIEGDISIVRAKIYDDHLKKVQFKTRIEKVLREQPEPSESEKADEEFWLWVWLKKLLALIEASLLDDDQDGVRS